MEPEREESGNHLDFLSPTQMAAKWGITLNAIKMAIDKGDLPARTIQKAVIIECADAAKWIRSHDFKKPKQQPA